MPVLVTKLHAPAPRERLVPRPRLLEAFDGLLEPGQRLGLVSAPAGFGKTTLVSHWTSRVAHDPDLLISVAWVSLDEADNDLGRLMAHILIALQRAGAPVDLGPLEAAGSGALDVTSALALLTTVVNNIAATAEAAGHGVGGPRAASETDLGGSCRWLLVLDDYHVISAPGVHEVIGYLLDNLPEQLRVLVSTRSDPPVPLARLRSRGQLTELRVEQMRFTHAEAGRFLNQVMGLDLEEGDVAALDDRTEGWAAGLQLAGLSLKGRTRAQDVSNFIAAFTGSNRFVVDYLTDEVLAQQRTVCVASCSAPPCWTSSQAGYATRSRVPAMGRQSSSGWTGTTCSSCRSMRRGPGTGTTTCSPTSCAHDWRPASRISLRTCTAQPATGTPRTTPSRTVCGTPSPATTSNAQAG
jgi:LuxR family transcriptional regulator, maltose regulon positive regulatory protein